MVERSPAHLLGAMVGVRISVSNEALLNRGQRG